MKAKPDVRGGFSLIEVALALLVASVGLLAVVGMLPGGLDNSKKATDDTQQALFADYVLNSFRAYAASTNYFWSDFNASGPQIPIAAYSMWDNGASMSVRPGDSEKTIAFKPAADNKITEMTIVYSLTLHDQGANMKRVELKTWTGSAVNTNSVRVFYADLFRGDLK